MEHRSTLATCGDHEPAAAGRRPPPPQMPLHVQLWSYNFDPEPTGIGPVSTSLARGLRDRGCHVNVVSAHPHYPEPRWGRRRLPYRESRDGIAVLRLPLWPGRSSAAERYRQELTYMASLFAALPALGRPDVVVSASPSFPALLPAIVNVRARRLPWLLWLQDVLPEGAASSGIAQDGPALALARRLERAAYRHSHVIAVPSRAFVHNLSEKGAPTDKIRLVPNPATWTTGARAAHQARRPGPMRLLCMGNIGSSQGLAPLVEAFERSTAMSRHDVRLVITGTGVAAEEVRSRIKSDRVEMPGLVDEGRLEAELQRADLALVTQRHGLAEFNLPSKLMNFMAYGLPVLAVVSPRSEVARIVSESGGGWVVDSAEPSRFPATVEQLLEARGELARRGAAGAAYADRHFTRSKHLDRFEAAIREAMARARLS